MTSIILVGASDSDKITLANCFKHEKAGKSYILLEDRARGEQVKKSNSWESQKSIARRQNSQEEEFEGRDYICIHSVVDVITRTYQWKKNKFPALVEGHGKKGEALEFLSTLFGNAASRVLQRYRRSLVVLVTPTDNATGDNQDGQYDEVEQYTNLAGHILTFLGCAYVYLLETERPAQVELLKRAVKTQKESVLPSPLANLDYFANLNSNKPNDRAKAKTYFVDLNLPFYLKYDRSMFELPCLFLSQAELRLSINSPERGQTNRFLQKRGSSEGVFLLEFSREVPPHIVCDVLGGNGLRIQGELYNFLGCSSSGLKARKCWLLKGSQDHAHRTRQELGNFAAIKTISKQVARFSLLLSNVVPTPICPASVLKEPDVERNGSNFTDGCGCISADLAEKIFRHAQKGLRRVKDKGTAVPSVFQIRHQGNKGVLTKNSLLDPKSVVIRPSMTKFETSEFPEICVCDYSRPHAYGHLNRQFIQLLSGLGVPDEVFEELQQQHFERVRNMLHDRDSALMLLEGENKSEEFADYMEGKKDDDVAFADLRNLRSTLIGQSERLRILVPESRTLFGVAERPQFCNKIPREGILKPGECLVRITMRGQEQPYSLSGQQVMVGKNPSYLLGEIRVLKAVSSAERPELRQIERDCVDCIVFPIEGNQPHSEQIAGRYGCSALSF